MDEDDQIDSVMLDNCCCIKAAECEVLPVGMDLNSLAILLLFDCRFISFFQRANILPTLQ